MFRYGITHSDVRDNGIGGFDLISRGYHSQFTNQTVQVAETAVIGTPSTKRAFSIYRSATQTIANSLDPATLVLQSFNGGGSALGHTFDTQNSYELQNYTSSLQGTHSWRFGVRLRGQTDDSISPQNFNGTFTFGGGALAPVLDAQNRPRCPGALAPITSIERYRRTLLFQQLGDTPAQIRALGGGATQFSINAGIAELAVHQMDVGLLRRRRVARAAQPHAEPRAPLRDPDQHPRPPRFRAARRLRLGARRRRTEARQDRAARRLRHLLRPLRPRQHAHRAALQRHRAAAVRGHQSRFLPHRAAACDARRLPIHAGHPGDQRRPARALHPAIRRHAGAPVAEEHHAGRDLHQLARPAPVPLGGHQRAAARTAESFRSDIPARSN